jgi:type IV pilus assembly protein PilF
MKMIERLLLACVLSLAIAGCVETTTTVGGVRPDADESDAAELNYQLGARYYRNGNYELARDRLLTSIDLYPRNAVAHYTLALTYEALGNLRLATESYDQAISIAPRDHQVQNAYAVFLCNQRKYDDARQHFDRAAAIKTNDDPEITLTNAGVCMMQKPDQPAAESYFRQALEHKRNYGEALIQMAALKYSTGEHLSARAFLQRYLSVNPAAADALYLGVQIEDALGDERAKTVYSEQILRDFPTSRQARLILDADQR